MACWPEQRRADGISGLDVDMFCFCKHEKRTEIVNVRANQSLTSLVNIGPFLFCSHDFSSGLYFSGRAEMIHGAGIARKSPVSRGESFLSLQIWEIAHMVVAPADLLH